MKLTGMIVIEPPTAPKPRPEHQAHMPPPLPTEDQGRATSTLNDNELRAFKVLNKVAEFGTSLEKVIDAIAKGDKKTVADELRACLRGLAFTAYTADLPYAAFNSISNAIPSVKETAFKATSSTEAGLVEKFYDV